jgi:hypothetical protein
MDDRIRIANPKIAHMLRKIRIWKSRHKKEFTNMDKDDIVALCAQSIGEDCDSVKKYWNTSEFVVTNWFDEAVSIKGKARREEVKNWMKK